MASDSARSTAEYVTDTSGSSVQIVAPVVDLTGEATASSNGPPSHVSAHSVPVVSVRSSSGRDQDSPHAASIQDAISVQSSHISSAHGQSSSDDEETAQARMEAALAAQEVANQRLACIRAKKRSSRSSQASSAAGAMSPPPGLLGSLPTVPEPDLAPLLPEEVHHHRRDALHAPRDLPGPSNLMNPELPIHESANLMNPELPIREPARIGPLQMLSSIFGGGERRSHDRPTETRDREQLEIRPRHWHDTELDDANQRAALADLGLIKDRLEKFEREAAMRNGGPTYDKPLRKSNSSYGTPEDLIDMETPPAIPMKKVPQVFSMTPRPLQKDLLTDDWEMETEGLTEKEINLRCLKLLDLNRERQLRQRGNQEPRRPPKKNKDGYNELNEHEINLRLAQALEQNNRVADGGPPSSPPSSSSSSSSTDSDHSSHRSKKKIKKVKKEHLKNIPKAVKEKDLKLPPLPEAPDFDTWKDKVYHKIVTAAQRGSAIHPWIEKVELPEVTFDDLCDPEGYETLDAALCSAIFEIARGELSGTLTLQSRELRSKGQLMTGRQALYVLYAEFAIDEERGALYDLSDLMLVKYKSDEHAPRFLNLWLHTVQGLSEKQPENNLMTLLKAQLEHSSALKDDISHFNRLSKGDPERNYDYLIESLKRFVNKTKKNINREKTLVRLSGGQPRPTVLALPAEEERGGGACIAFQNTGRCRFGDRCKYTHSQDAAAKAKAKAKPKPKADPKAKPGAKAKPKPKAGPRTEYDPEQLAARAKIPCNAFSNGRCRFGDKCHYSHSADSANVAMTAPAVDVTYNSDFEVTTSEEEEDRLVRGVMFIDMVTDDDDDEEPLNLNKVHVEPHTDHLVQEFDMALIVSEVTPVRHRVSQWAIDTASANHLIGRNKIDNQDIHLLQKMDRPKRLATANGIITMDQTADVNVGSINLTVAPIVMNHCPDVLSAGKLVMEHGFSFNWLPYMKPTLTDAKGRTVELALDNLVPILPQKNGSVTRVNLSAVPALPGEPDFEGSCIPQTPPRAEGSEVPQTPTHGDAAPGTPPLPRRERQIGIALGHDHLMTHFPKCNECDVCVQAKMYMAPARRRDPDLRDLKAENFADLLWSDHIIVGKNKVSRGNKGEKVGLLIYDVATHIQDIPALKNKNAQSTFTALMYFLGNHSGKRIYSDNAGEIAVAAERMRMVHATSTPHKPQSNGLCENRVKQVVQGTRCNVLQSGFPHRFWPLAARHWTFAKSITPLDDDPSPYARLHGAEFDGLRVPFGALVIYKATKRQQAKRMKFDPTGVYGIFVGYHLHPGYTHSKDYLVIDLDHLRGCNLDTDKVTVLRVREVIVPDPIKFPIRERRMALQDAPTVDTYLDVKSPDDDPAAGAGSIHPDSSEEDSLGGDTDAESVHSMGSRSAMSEEEWRKECEDLFGDVDEDFDNPVPARPSALRAAPLQRPPDITLVAWNRMGRRARRRAVREHDGGMPAAGPDEVNDRLFMAIPAREIPIVAPAIRSGDADKRLTNRLLMEYCCGENSRLCSDRYAARGCATVRLTIANDLTTPEGLDYAMQELERAHAAGLNIALWASLPCTAGTPWYRLNKKFAGARDKHAAQLATFHKLMDNFMILAERVVTLNGDLHWEWPTHCELWQDPKVQHMLQYFSMHTVNLHGCALGLTSAADGRPIKKPWTVATTSVNMHSAFKSALCPGTGPHREHAQCAGAETRRTEEYTDAFADLVHEAILQDTMDISGAAAVAESAEHATPDVAADDHRERVPGPGLWCALVTKTLSPKDPLSRSPKALKAVQAELDDLRKSTTWDESNPMEFDALLNNNPKAHVARLFPIVGVKNFEDPDEELHRWKGRVVLGGHAIKTVTGDWAVFNDIGSVPSTMTCLLYTSPSPRDKRQSRMPSSA